MDTRKTILIFLFSSLISVKTQTHAIIGLFPINLDPANEVISLRTALNEYRGKYLPPNTQLDIKLYNNSNKPGLTMKIMLDTFTRPNNFTAIIGPGDEKAIHTVDQYLSTIPGNVLHFVNNPVIHTKKYLHNMAPSVSQIVDLLIELLQNMKWNYVAVLRDSTEFSKLSSKIFQKKAESEHICIGLIEAIYLNVKPNLDPIKAAKIKGVIVFGTKDIVRLISKHVKDGDFRFIFVSNENLHEENINMELPNLSLQVTWNGPSNESSRNNKLNYIDDSVEMALKWFNICQTEFKCRDLPQKEIILEIYQKLNNKRERIGTFTRDLTLNSKLNEVESICKSGCEKCRKLDCVGNLYNLTSGEYYVVVLLPIHGRGSSSHFRCNCSINVLHSVDLMEAAKFAISTSAKPDLGLIIIDTCMQPIITTEQLIDIDYTHVLGVIGGFYSLTTIPAAEILTRLKIPQISFGAESHILSDQERFPYFQRTIISMRPKAKAVILLCKRMGWKAINIMYNKEPFGVSGRSLIMEYAQIHGICVVNDIGVELKEVQFQTYLNQLRRTSKVKVTLTFFLEESQKKWLKVLNEDLEANEFLIIEVYGIRDDEIQKMLKKHFSSQVIIEANKPFNQEFLEYYENLQQEEIEKNPLAKKFIEKINQCHFDGSFNMAYEKKCEYRLQANSVSTYHDLLIKAIYALINGTRNATNNFADFKQRNPADIVRKIRKTRFNISGKEQRLFDDEGKSQIQLFNLLKVKTIDPLEYEKIAVYESESWQIDDLDKLSQVTSTCSSDDFCTKCPEVKSDPYFLVFVILDSILAFMIVVLIGVFVWKKKSNILAYFGGVCP